MIKVVVMIAVLKVRMCSSISILNWVTRGYPGGGKPPVKITQWQPLKQNRRKCQLEFCGASKRISREMPFSRLIAAHSIPH